MCWQMGSYQVSLLSDFCLSLSPPPPPVTQVVWSRNPPCTQRSDAHQRSPPLLLAFPAAALGTPPHLGLHPGNAIPCTGSTGHWVSTCMPDEMSFSLKPMAKQTRQICIKKVPVMCMEGGGEPVSLYV
ncbi:hypothetical protein lerEdw1_013043 [Lerista edwardsae]|nr:hypothetical protein lerEdw1_013043 [Lerista edwardsae]